MPFPFIPLLLGAAAQGGQALINNAAADKQAASNLEIAKFQAAANERYLQQQLEYNSPKNQMLRFQEAGLNPNLIYGQGNPGSQSAPLSHPQIQPADYQKAAVQIGQLLPQMNSTRLIDSQVDANNARTTQAYQMTQLNKVQEALLSKNPLLNDEGFKAIIEGLKGSAMSKVAEGSMQQTTAEWFNGVKRWTGLGGQEVEGPPGAYKLQRELMLLDEKFGLAQADAKIKAKIVTSKEFQNQILEVQKKFMTDAEITPAHIVQFIQLLLMKLL